MWLWETGRESFVNKNEQVAVYTRSTRENHIANVKLVQIAQFCPSRLAFYRFKKRKRGMFNAASHFVNINAPCANI